MDYEPQLTALVDTPPDGDDWLHEIKYDGYRIGCLIENGRARLITRNGQNYTAALPEVVAAVKTLGTQEALIDGEVVVLRPDGRASFTLLQQALAGTGSRATLTYIVFDLLHLDGVSLAARPLEERKARLQALLAGGTSARLRYAEHVVGGGPRFYAEAQRLGLEGIVSKRRNAPYSAGRRGGWLKIKCPRRQPFVVGGFTDRANATGTVGSLLVGCYQDKRLVFAGRVGTGFSGRVAHDLHVRLSAMERATSPFNPPPEPAMAKDACYVAPTLVCDVSFTEWTGDDRIRHPVFLGLLDGVKPKTVTRRRD